MDSTLRSFRRGAFIQRTNGVTYSIAANSDIAPELLAGDADFALVGSDKFGELDTEAKTRLCFEPIGTLACRFALLVPEAFEPPEGCELRVATSYPNALADFIAVNSISAVCTRVLSGKVERAPASGMTDAAFDIVETGNSLRANGLRIALEGERIELGGLWRTEQ